MFGYQKQVDYIETEQNDITTNSNQLGKKRKNIKLTEKNIIKKGEKGNNYVVVGNR